MDKTMASEYDVCSKSSTNHAAYSKVEEEDRLYIVDQISFDQSLKEEDIYPDLNCSSEVIVLRRSERIKEQLARKERLQTLQNSQTNSASCPVNGRKKRKKKDQKLKKLPIHIKKVSSICQVRNEKVPECIKGVVDMDKNRIVVVKWKGIDNFEYVHEKNLNPTLKDMLKSYLNEQLKKLSNNVTDEDSLSNDIKKEKRNILDFKTQQQLCIQDKQLLNTCDYAVDVKLNL